MTLPGRRHSASTTGTRRAGHPVPAGQPADARQAAGADGQGCAPWAPMWALKMVTDRSLDIYLSTEDLPRLDNQITVDGDKIMISWTANNLSRTTNW